ncbi:hypothetical protein VTN31DRAFT_4180 [Thermomyces dupontii]|uniref:uncharacterized protein n=1 Tax=Talaromyces thermophilus TaxID=28565 RepID=UPI003744AB1B
MVVMSLKQEIETWVKALNHYDNNEYEEALRVFAEIADTSKILFNCGVIHATLGEHEKAVECYQAAIRLDNYFAVAYFQQGVSNFLLGDFEEALANFNDTLLYLRGNTSIDYEQLGLKFKLYSCEVLFNRGLCYIYLQQMEPGMQDLQYAAKEKVTRDHDVIDEAIRERAEGYTVFSIPVGVVYRPNEAKVKNLKSKDYLGKARLVAATDKNNAFTGFQGVEVKKAMATEAKDDRPPESISYAATNLVQRNLSSRSRQQSEPPIGRNTFPPTPPPENEKPGSANNGGAGITRRAQSVRGQRPPYLNFEQSGVRSNGRTEEMPSMEQSRMRPRRTASETRVPLMRQPSSRRLYGEVPVAPSRRDGDGLTDVYDMYGPQRGMRNRVPEYIDEDDEYGSDEDSAADMQFEMMPPTYASRSMSTRRSSRGKTVQSFRVKVHALDDIRYIMITRDTSFGELEGKIREKFNFRNRLRIRMRDDGDMITMGDQEDLDLLLRIAADEARRENLDMGKLEIWVEER